MLKKFFWISVLFILFTFTPVMAQTPETIRVGLRSFGYSSSFTIRNTSLIADGNVFNSASGFTIRVSGLYAGANRVSSTPLRIAPNLGEFILLGNYQYRGIIEFRVSGNNLFPINIISLDYYLFGVVPREMGPSFHPQALKAQAVAARTFTLYRRNMQRYTGFDICDLSACCQIYRGAGHEHVNTTNAVLATSGLVIFYNNEPILASYFSSSGGSTDSSANVWGGNLSYLQGVFDIYETNPRIWSRHLSWSQLTIIANNRPGPNIGTATGLSITERGPTGRVMEIIIHGTLYNRSIRGEPVRTSLGLYSRNFTMDSDLFFITDGNINREDILENTYVLDTDGLPVRVTVSYIFDGQTIRSNNIAAVSDDTGATLNGRGWGHGVGMSQWGAEGMAQAGYTFLQILHFYYTGVEIR